MATMTYDEATVINKCGVEVSGHFEHAEVSWVQISEGPKCLYTNSTTTSHTIFKFNTLEFVDVT